MTAQDILDIVKAFFNALLEILKSLGIDFGNKETEPSEQASADE